MDVHSRENVASCQKIAIDLNQIGTSLIISTSLSEKRLPPNILNNKRETFDATKAEVLHRLTRKKRNKSILLINNCMLFRLIIITQIYIYLEAFLLQYFFII